MIDQVRNTLIGLQNRDGGWGAAEGRRSNTEATSLALSALHAAGESAANDRVLRSRASGWPSGKIPTAAGA